MIRTIRSGRIAYILFLWMLAIEACSLLESSNLVAENAPFFVVWLFAKFTSLTGSLIIKYSVPVSYFLIFLTAALIARINDDFLKLRRWLLLADLLANLFLCINYGWQLKTHLYLIGLEAVICLLVFLMDRDYRKANKADLSYRKEERRTYRILIKLMEWIDGHFSAVSAGCFIPGLICMIFCIIYEQQQIQWLINLMIAFFSAGLLTCFASVILDNRKQTERNIGRTGRTIYYNETLAGENGIDVNVFTIRIIGKLSAPLIIMYLAAILVNLKTPVTRAFEVIWMIVYAAVIIWSFVCIRQNTYLLEMKNVYYVRGRTNIVYKHRFDDPEYFVKMNRLKAISEDDQCWYCTYHDVNKAIKEIRIPKVYEKLIDKTKQYMPLTEENALEMLIRTKDERKADFSAPLSSEQQKEAEEHGYQKILAYYAVADGFRLTDEYSVISFRKSLEATAEMNRYFEENEGIEVEQDFIVIGECTDGGKLILKHDGRVIRTDYEDIGSVDSEWDSMASFIILTL
ncbi:MAG: hypothetical protein K6A14_05730 [Erysipelotrichaceae bacterium]|nr:hypothetical protein [Erysipelotrichaceae bacterium]